MKARPHRANILQQSLISRQPAGFTLLQTLVSAVVGAILVVSIAQMTGTGLRTMRESGGRMISAAKMHDLRAQLAADLDLVPAPSLGLGADHTPLTLESDATQSTLSLLLPTPQSTAWRRVSYQWSKKSGSVTRVEAPHSRGHQAKEAQVLATGVQSWALRCLAGADDTGGHSSWTSADRLPAAILCQVRLTGLRGYGNPATTPQTPTGEGRDYEWLLPLPGGGVP